MANLDQSMDECLWERRHLCGDIMYETWLSFSFFSVSKGLESVMILSVLLQYQSNANDMQRSS